MKCIGVKWAMGEGKGGRDVYSMMYNGDNILIDV